MMVYLPIKKTVDSTYTVYIYSTVLTVCEAKYCTLIAMLFIYFCLGGFFLRSFIANRKKVLVDPWPKESFKRFQ